MRTFSVALSLAIITVSPAQAEVIAQSENGFAVGHTVSVSVDPDAAFAMLRTPAKWWDKDHSWTGNPENLYMDAQAGGCFCELIPNAATTESGAPQRTLRGSVQHMQIVHVDPGKLLRMSGALGPLQSEAVTGTLTVTLAPIKGGTMLAFEYVAGGFMRIDVAVMAPAVDRVIGAQASRFAMALGPLVGGGSADETGPDPKPEAEEDTSGGDGEATGESSKGSGSSVSGLVADLEPDDTVSPGTDAEVIEDEPAEPEAATGMTDTTRPERKRSDED